MSQENVYLFVPNIIGYLRILLILIAFYYMPTHYGLATFCYVTSSMLDSLDGHAARALNQCSKFGALLDMLTDRCATMCLLVVLSQFYPKYTFWFQMSMIIDIASHWLYMQSSAMSGSGSHKKVEASGNPILKFYYEDSTFLFIMCVGNELFYSMLYLVYFTPGPVLPLGPLSFGIWTGLCAICAPIAILKALISLVQLYVACETVVAVDVEERKKLAVGQKVE